jgi:hypothetical protein
MITHTSLESLEKYRDRLGDELYLFLKGLWEIRSSAPSIDWEPKEAQPSIEMLAQEPYFVGDAPLISAEMFKVSYLPILRYMASKNEGLLPMAEELEKSVLPELVDADFENALTDTPGLIVTIANRIELELSQDQLMMLNFTIAQALSPFAIQAASKISLPEKLELADGSCPICGQMAEIAYLEEPKHEHGAPRRLWCDFCEADWAYERIRCVPCGERSQTKLSYHFDEADDSRRIYYCTECDQTMKVLVEGALASPDQIDLRLESTLMMGLEEAVSAHVAEKKIADSN